RGRARAGRRHRPHRRGRVRDAPGGGPQGDGAALGPRRPRPRDRGRGGARGPRRAGDRRRRGGLPRRQRPVRRGPGRRRGRRMRAKAAYRLLVGRDSVEVVDIADGETVLLWDLAPTRVPRFARRVREDLNTLPADEFLERWTRVAGPG